MKYIFRLLPEFWESYKALFTVYFFFQKQINKIKKQYAHEIFIIQRLSSVIMSSYIYYSESVKYAKKFLISKNFNKKTC